MINWLISGIVITGFSFWFLPVYWVWSARKRGEAQLAEAENAEKVAMMKANARLNAAKANKEAEVIEAEAVSLSIEKIGNSLEENPSYNKWQWIKMMDRDNDKSVIYVPTEANIPILEASRLQKPVKIEIKQKES